MLHKSDLEDDIAVYIRDRVPKARIETVFDVGANVGWATLQFLKAFPGCEVWSFEPVGSLNDDLKENLARFSLYSPFPRTHCVKVALGDREESAEITSQPGVTVNRIGENPNAWPTENVQVQTGDEFCRQSDIKHIDFLKVDAEGYDLKILHGFKDLIASADIDFIQVEASLHSGNLDHTELCAFSDFLIPRGYSLFRFTNQASGKVPILSRSDVVFIRDGAARDYSDD